MSQQPPAWSIEELVERQAYVMHVETQVAGKCVRLYKPGEWTSPINNQPVTDPVLELDTGDTFVLKPMKPDAIVPMSQREVDLYDGFTKIMGKALEIALRMGRSSQMPKLNALLIISVSLNMQQTRVRAEMKKLSGLAPAQGGGIDAFG